MKKKSKQIGIILLIVFFLYIFISLFNSNKYIVQYQIDNEIHTEIIEDYNQLEDFKKELDSSGTQYWIEVY